MAKTADSVFIADGAKLIGDIEIGEESSVWYNAVLRADLDRIRIGRRTNIQEVCAVHVDIRRPVIIGDDVTIGHGAIVHGCRIGNNVMIGMGSIIMDWAEIGDNCLIGAGTLVTEHKVIPPGSLVYGNPGRVIRPLTETEIQDLRDSAQYYADEAQKEKRMQEEAQKKDI